VDPARPQVQRTELATFEERAGGQDGRCVGGHRAIMAHASVVSRTRSEARIESLGQVLWITVDQREDRVDAFAEPRRRAGDRRGGRDRALLVDQPPAGRAVQGVRAYPDQPEQAARDVRRVDPAVAFRATRTRKSASQSPRISALASAGG
jgi:hypothetical protein